MFCLLPLPRYSVRLERTTTTTTTLYIPSPKQAGRILSKLVLERTLVADTSDIYLTPNATLTGMGDVPDVVPRPDPYSPASDEYRTPDSTLVADGTLAMPTYFDRKKTTAASVIAAVVEPLTNFQILKQKSLNTIPALLERHTKKNEELFNNFPFLTPLAHRKSSLASAASRLSGCIEDEFYCIPSEPEAELGSQERVDVRHRFRSASSRALHEPEPALATSTPHALRHSYSDRTR